MGRGRGKGKKLSVSNYEEIHGTGEDEKVGMQKRRGRPQKVIKDEFDDEENEKIEEYDSSEENTTREGRKRKRNIKEKIESVEEKNGVANGSKSNGNSDELTKCNGFRHNGSRRKSKPRRAAEAGVFCKPDYAI